MSTDNKKISWREACEILGCKKSHFYNLVNSGSIPAQRFGKLRGILVYKKDCIEYLRSSTNKFQNNLDNV